MADGEVCVGFIDFARNPVNAAAFGKLAKEGAARICLDANSPNLSLNDMERIAFAAQERYFEVYGFLSQFTDRRKK